MSQSLREIYAAASIETIAEWFEGDQQSVFVQEDPTQAVIYRLIQEVVTLRAEVDELKSRRDADDEYRWEQSDR